MMSPTLQKLYYFAQSSPADIHDKEDLQAAFSTTGLQLINALDNERITFADDIDRAMLLGLLTVVIDYTMDGNLKNSFKPASVN